MPGEGHGEGHAEGHAEAGVEQPARTNSDDGLADEYDPGLDAGTDPGMESGTDPGMEPGTDPGTEPGGEPGAEFGTESGEEPGKAHGDGRLKLTGTMTVAARGGTPVPKGGSHTGLGGSAGVSAGTTVCGGALLGRHGHLGSRSPPAAGPGRPAALTPASRARLQKRAERRLGRRPTHTRNGPMGRQPWLTAASRSAPDSYPTTADPAHREATVARAPAHAPCGSSLAAKTLDRPTAGPSVVATAPNTTTVSPRRPRRKNVPSSARSSLRKGPLSGLRCALSFLARRGRASPLQAATPTPPDRPRRGPRPNGRPSTGAGAGGPAGRWIHCASNRT